MPWFYVDDGFSDSKPVLNMPHRYRYAACGLWVLAGSWSAKEETDGYIPESKLRELVPDPRTRRTLIGVLTMPDALCEQVASGLAFKSWAKWQRTRAELVRKRRADCARQAQWRAEHPDAKPHAMRKGRNAVTSDDPEMSHADMSVTELDVSQRDSRAHPRAGVRPDPTRPDPSLVTYGTKRVDLVNANQPTPFCPEHMPNGTPDSCGACKQHRIKRDAWMAAQDLNIKRTVQAEARAAATLRAQAIDACPLGCKIRDGYRENGLTCDHIDHTPTNAKGSAAVREALNEIRARKANDAR
jgi:hypothetical protein